MPQINLDEHELHLLYATCERRRRDLEATLTPISSTVMRWHTPSLENENEATLLKRVMRSLRVVTV